MPTERVAMRHAREIIRLKYSSNAPTREIARRLGLAPSTVWETLKRFEDAGLVWSGLAIAGAPSLKRRGVISDLALDKLILQ